MRTAFSIVGQLICGITFQLTAQTFPVLAILTKRFHVLSHARFVK